MLADVLNDVWTHVFYPTKLGKIQAHIEPEDNLSIQFFRNGDSSEKRLETPQSELGRMETEHQRPRSTVLQQF